MAPYFRIAMKDASAIIERSQTVVRQWPKVAKSLRIPAREQQQMASAFKPAEWRKNFDLDEVVVVRLRQRRKIQTRGLFG